MQNHHPVKRENTRMDTARSAPVQGPTLPANRAFVVQFRTAEGDGSEASAGRVEHLVSGQATRFASVEELLAFIARVLSDVSKKAAEET